MKTSKIYFILLTIMLQSCYSYRTINTNCNNLMVGNTYKIQQDSIFKKIKIKVVTDSTIIVKYKKAEKEIYKKDILAIKQKQLSAGKTVTLVTPITTITLTALILAFLFH